MHLVDESDAVPLTSVEQLRAYFADAGKPVSEWRVGSELELVGVDAQTGEAPPYAGERGIEAVMTWFGQHGWTPVIERGHMIALSRGDAQLTIEPGGQFELAGRPVTDDRMFAEDLREHVAALGAASHPLGLAWLSIGLRPFGGRGEVPIMPKQRYDVMRAYMPTVGTRGLDMMLRTATVQSNLDFADEADASAKMKCLYSVTSLMTALWAASPIVEDKVSGYQTWRAWIWRDTDNQRSGLLPFVFDRDDIFTAYTEWALDVPMYFVYRHGYLAVPADLTFRKFMRDGWNGEHAIEADWALHLSTLFPEGRLKKFLEVRGCDCGSLGMIAALAPFCRGLLYDPVARAAATSLTAGLSFADRQRLADEVPKTGFATRVGKATVGELARELVTIVHDGLRRRAPDSLSLIAPVEQIATTGRTQSDDIIAAWNAHAGDRRALIAALAHPGLG